MSLRGASTPVLPGGPITEFENGTLTGTTLKRYCVNTPESHKRNIF